MDDQGFTIRAIRFDGSRQRALFRLQAFYLPAMPPALTLQLEKASPLPWAMVRWQPRSLPMLLPGRISLSPDTLIECSAAGWAGP